MSLKSPNEEQKKAIFHEGGVLLKAGAGSGKTFVLVEHIIHLSKMWIKEFQDKRMIDFDDFIRSKYSKVVLMTFTKKAAGEMSIRLYERFKLEEELSVQDHNFWVKCNEAMLSLNVTTIDGFCKKLISNGYFPKIPTESNVIFFRERKNQIQKIFDEYLEKENINISNQIREILGRQKKALLNSFSFVFNDPSLRLVWRGIRLDEFSPLFIEDILKKSFELNDLKSSLDNIYSLDIPEFKECSAFEKNVKNFQGLIIDPERPFAGLKEFHHLFLQMKSLQPERTASKKDAFHQSAYEGLVKLRNWLRDWVDNLSAYESSFQEKILPWMTFCKKTFDYIDFNIDPSEGLTFGDIEFIVYEGLLDEKIRSKVTKDFSYFIVDEFQDTSEIQFQIISLLIENNFDRLFCVGDAKQAIYGFRGGELAVFHRCSKLISQEMSLVCNYRSMSHIISFNNKLFSHVLPLGREFQGNDPFSVIPEDQAYPFEESEEDHKIERVLYKVSTDNLPENERLPTDSINRFEAQAISKYLEKLIQESELESFAILYQRLAPSFFLIQELMKKEIGFTSQFKINIKEDPILYLIFSLLGLRFDENKNRDEYISLLLKSVFFHLNLNIPLETSFITSFENDLKFWGIKIAVFKFLSKLNITIENYDISLQVLDQFVDLFGGDQEKVVVSFQQEDQEKISLDLRSGKSSERVQIMTAHASKGLEFDVVFLAGIHSNGRDSVDDTIFGKLPGSFVWFEDISQKKKKITPHFQFEKELTKYKEFSESKRLFYVACTRAKRRLIWIDFEEIPFTSPKNSWIEALRSWRRKNYFETIVLDLNVDEELRVKNSLQPETRLPLYFYDPVGVYLKNENISELTVISDLSVTRLTALLDCPRKHYFQNILRIDLDEDNSNHFFESDEESLTSYLPTQSSAERGTQIHDWISQMIFKRGVIPREVLNTDLLPKFEWLKQELENYKDSSLKSETPIKFKLFNFMISGIPDLVIESKDSNFFKIWDFKTGNPSSKSEEKYWFQLMIYAYASFVMNPSLKGKEIELALIYIDVLERKTRLVSFSEVDSFLFEIWKDQLEPWKTKTDHCSQCSFGDICQR